MYWLMIDGQKDNNPLFVAETLEECQQWHHENDKADPKRFERPIQILEVLNNRPVRLWWYSHFKKDWQEV